MKLIWTDPAIADRLTIYDHIDVENPRAAVELDTLFVQAAEHICNHPAMGRNGKIPGTREWVVHRHYLLVYEHIADKVLMLAVVHTARQWPPLLDDESF
ncbi:type II toxin-antitoxin system RelE/ParE family toxin [Pseudomonas gingeri NCPPB 3146 = LMG 5327]|uniref:Type II toxin-antitoxin system RelE/ParE family toxin n=2 Tax=Pseudomonas gingeri TaxID=117681 RepID=A0A7Y7Y6Q0_9PSED|nr:type II toxin-antitoxin system RelE/ParE family toxin [Pseudomonas gingeri]NWA04829.1 type II toxin-antitoxin system RelE/ParE family toxin [Pseudomonas gingeri]NWA17710.1 type II toxin-antitoxin system RelE/ParE family toxin [Pseudomonas gingeri]NWA56882.1 type II toxin-antitoxin system RelE/ParE family toxin [Pseudomonas gingeri]NWA97252.1 type II toxin-antitoxin system RelE/ParE family toxin [Pseudomonas gingeri]NWB01696.1 type II toxin-antitoxin system RelE/ParE family toxin [Pseudomona